MKKPSKKEEVAAALQAFKECLGSAAKALEAAAKIYYAAVKRNGRYAQDAFLDAYPGTDSEWWSRMFAVGSGLAIPETLYLSDKTSRIVERMPLKEQRQMLSGVKKVSVVTARGRVVEKPLVRLTMREEGVLVAPEGRLRSVEEQKAVRAAERESAVPVYEVVGKQLRVHRPFTFGRATLLEILEEMG